MIDDATSIRSIQGLAQFIRPPSYGLAFLTTHAGVSE